MAEVRIGVNVDATGAVKGFKLISTGSQTAGKDAAQLGKTLHREVEVRLETMAGRMGPFGNIMKSLGPAGLAAAAGLAAIAVAGVGAFKALEGVARAFAALVVKGDKLADLAARTDISTAALQRLEYASGQAGVSFEQTVNAVRSLERRLVVMPKKFEELGLSVERLIEMEPDKAFDAVALAISQLPTQAERTAAAMELLGDSGAQVLALIASGATAAGDEFELLGGVLSDDVIKNADLTNDSFVRLQTALGAFKDQALALAMTDQLGTFLTGLAVMVAIATSNLDEFIGKLAAMAKAVSGSGAAKFALDTLTFGAGSRVLGGVAGLAEDVQKQGEAYLFLQEQKREARQREIESQTRSFRPTGAGAGGGGKEIGDAEKALGNAEREALKLSGALEGRLHKAWDQNGDDIDRMSNLVTEYSADAEKLASQDLDRLEKAHTDMAKAAEEGLRDVVAATFDWQIALQGVALVAGAVGGKLGETLQVMENIGQSFQGFSKMSDEQKFGAIAGGVGQIGGLVGGKTGSTIQGAAGGAMTGFTLGGPVGAVAGGLIGGVMGFLGGRKREKEAAEQARQQFEQLTQALRTQFGSLGEAERAAQKYGVSLQGALDSKNAEELNAQLAEIEKRMKGLQAATAGLQTLLENLTFVDLEGNIVNTFDDPKMAENASQLFSSTFWATWRAEGVAGLEKLRPMWDKMHEQLVGLGLDPTALGLGRIGDLMSQTADPRARALLGVSRGAGQMVSGMMDAGFMSQADLAAASGMSQAALEELVAQGMDSTTAAQAMSGDLAALAKAYDAQGAALPDWLQQAMEAAGIDILPSQLKVLEEIRDILKGREGFARGGRGDFGDGTFVPLHGREVIVPEADLASAQAAGDGAVTFDAEGRPRPARRRQGPRTVEQTNVQITQQPVFNIDPLQTKQSREDLGKYLIGEWQRSARSDPTTQYLIRRAAGTE